MGIMMPRYKCDVCGFVYDPAKGDPEQNIPAGTLFEELPEGWACRDCGAGRESFSLCKEPAPVSRTVAVLPARYGSSRFPGKPLALIAGKPMIQWCYESVKKCPDLDDVVMATDDQRIYDAVQQFGGKAVMTRADHQTGTDRIAEAVESLDADLIVNVQGDEPLMSAAVLSRLIAQMRSSGADMGTAAVPFSVTGRDPADPNAVKVVLDGAGNALYFSRSLIPFPRPGGVPVEPLLHWGLYAYRREFLYRFVQWPMGRLESCEKLEQLRALENGAKIAVLVTEEQSAGVDVPGDIALVEKRIAELGLK